VETEVSSTESKRLEARMNAMLALQEALGELQRTTGPDQRVTATGSLWENPAKGTEHLVGVWSAEDNDDDDRADGEFLRWLVSRADRTEAEQIGMVNAEQPIAFVAEGDDSYYSSPDTHVVLVSTGSTFPTDLSDANEPMRGVAAEKREVRGDGDQVVGKYAWWVGDEGAKAKINIIDPVSDDTLTDEERDRFRLAAGMSMPRAAGEAMEGLDFLQPNQPEFARMQDGGDLDFLAGNPADPVKLRATKERFHDFTFWSYGVQSDTKNGGLKKDLSLLFELSESEWRDTEFYKNSPTRYENAPYINGKGESGDYVSLLFNPKNGDKIDGQELTIDLGDQQIYGPTWDKLRDYYRTYREVENRDSNPIIKARSYKPSTTELVSGESPSKQFVRSASRDTMRAWYIPDPLLSKQRLSLNGRDHNGGGVNAIDKAPNESYLPVSRLTASNRAPHLIRFTLQLCVDRTGPAVDYVLVPVVYLHNPFNIRLETEHKSRVVLDVGNKGALWSTYDGSFVEYNGSKSLDFLSFTPDGSTPVSGSGVSSGDGRFQPSEGGFKFSIPAGEVFEPGEIRAYFPGPGQVVWTSDAKTELQLFDASARMAKGLSGLVIHSERLDQTVAASTGLPYVPGRMLKTSFDIGSSKEVFMYTYELGMNANPGNRQYDIVGAYKAHLFGKIQGFNWKRISGIKQANREAEVNSLPGVGPTDARTVIFSFDSYLKPVELLYPSADGSVEYAAQEALGFPAFVASNPLSPGEDRFSAYRQGSGIFSPQRNAYMSSQSSVINPDTLMTGALNADRGIWGDTVNGGQTNRITPLDLPSAPMQSLGQLQHANLLDQPHYPALAIGNAFPSPFLTGNDTIYNLFSLDRAEGFQYGGQSDSEKAFIDLSYFANQTLWDGYFFSSIAPLETDASFDNRDLAGNIVDTVEQFVAGTRKLNNPRIALYRASGESDTEVGTRLQAYERSAARLLVGGSFNVNSASVEAWRTFLGGLNEAEVLAYDGNSLDSLKISQPAAFLRHAVPSDEVSLQGDYQDAETWQGHKALDADELNELAVKIVEQIRERAEVLGGVTPQPFTSLGAFINRMPYSTDEDHRARGLLQQSIDTAGINDNLFDDAVEQMDAANLDSSRLDTLFNTSWNASEKHYRPFENQDFQLSSAAAAPGYLLQSDVLQALAPYLSVRSDTFRIRTYGEVLDPVTGESEGKAWLEAIVQRTPVPVVARSGSPDEPETVSSDLGRRYKIVKVNWLDEDQI
jgi:hypothetical protein